MWILVLKYRKGKTSTAVWHHSAYLWDTNEMAASTAKLNHTCHEAYGKYSTYLWKVHGNYTRHSINDTASDMEDTSDCTDRRNSAIVKFYPCILWFKGLLSRIVHTHYIKRMCYCVCVHSLFPFNFVKNNLKMPKCYGKCFCLPLHR